VGAYRLFNEEGERMRVFCKRFGVLVALAVAVSALTGCPAVEDLSAKVVTTLQANSVGDALAAEVTKNAVPLDEIESLWVTVSSIELVPIDGFGTVEIVTDDVEVDLLNRAVVAVEEVPAGTYSQIRLSYWNPRMTLTSDPDTVINDIQETAQSRLFITQTFSLPIGTSVFEFDLDGAKIVALGNGGYTWTPQLHGVLATTAEDITAEGTITAIDSVDETITVDLDSASLAVDYSDADIYLPGDTDTPTGTVNDLDIDADVQVTGDITAGVLEADEIHIQAE
jgi:hypothetical protein